MEAVWKLLLAVSLTWWPPNMLVLNAKGAYKPKVETNTMYVVAIGRKNGVIFCLGAIISPQVIITLASSFEQKKVENYLERWRREEASVLQEMNELEDDESEYIDGGRSPYRSNHRKPPDKFSLYRIDEIRRVFVRLTTEILNRTPHPDYSRLDANLWQYDLQIVSTTTLLDFGQNTIRPIRLYIDEFGNYMKSLDNAMMNTENCHVIGLVKYSQNASYTPRDTDVKLISHHVLLNYDFCKNQFCRDVAGNTTGSCRGTGYHISNDNANPIPHLLPGSPLVCQGRLASLVNTRSRCDETKFSGEFPSPPTIRFLITWFSAGNKNITMRQEGIPNSTWPSIPFPKWKINIGRQQVPSRVCISTLVVVTTIISIWQ